MFCRLGIVGVLKNLVDRGALGNAKTHVHTGANRSVSKRAQTKSARNKNSEPSRNAGCRGYFFRRFRINALIQLLIERLNT